MNLTRYLLLLGFLLFYSTCISSTRRKRPKRKHRKQAFNRFQGVPFIKATHYFPMNISRGDNTKLVDIRGNATGMVYNNINASTAEQIGQVLSLNGIDNVINVKGMRDECITNPGKCTEGLSVAFWIKYAQGQFIISAGNYTKADDGPGFRFICSSCSKNNGAVRMHDSGTFLLELSTTTEKWRIHLDSIPRWWFHFAFTWSRNQGLKYYKNGKFVLGNKNPEFRYPRDTDCPKLITIGSPNSITALLRKPSYGKFSLGHLVIWTYEVSKFDMEIAFVSILTTSIKAKYCCQKLKEDPCVTNPCHDGATCQRMDMGDKYQCICPDIDHNRPCSGGEKKFAEHCEDRSDQCKKLASQEGFCDYRWRRMKEICPKACKLCGKGGTLVSNTELLFSSSLKVETQISHTTEGRLHSARKTLQYENNKAAGRNRSGLATRAILNKMIQTSSVQLNTIFGQEFVSTFTPIRAMRTREILLNVRFSACSLVGSGPMGTSTTNSFIVLSPSSSVSHKYVSVARTIDRARDSSVLFFHEKFTRSSLHKMNYLFSTNNIPQGTQSSKSSFLSHYSSGVTAQARKASSSQRTTQVSSTVTSPVIDHVTSSFISPNTTRISPSFTSSIISQTSTSTSFSSILDVTSSTKSDWSKAHLHLTKTTSSNSLVHTTSVRPLSSVVPEEDTTSLTCRVNSAMCICFNCDGASKNENACCIDLIDIKNIQQGVTMTVKNITVNEFHHIVMNVSRVTAEIVRNSLPGAANVRKRRSLHKQKNQSKPTSSRIRTRREALQPDISNSSIMSGISRVDAVIYSISPQAGKLLGVQTEFYVTVTSKRNGTNQMTLLDAKKLLKILTSETLTLERRLNISIESFTASHQQPSKLATTSSHPETLAPNATHGSQNMPMTMSTAEVPTTAVVGRLEDIDNNGLSQELLILVICAGIGGLVLISIVMAFIFTRFYRQRKGEFVPDKTYSKSHNKQNGEAGGEDVENIDTFIDPSTQITDVPHKPTRGAIGGAAGRGPKKHRKPMGVKVTYKPPEWD